MTKNYKWYRLLDRREVSHRSLDDILRLHGLKGHNHEEFCPYLVHSWENSCRGMSRYDCYVFWWNAHFGTKLHKHLAGVENAD